MNYEPDFFGFMVDSFPNDDTGLAGDGQFALVGNLRPDGRVVDAQGKEIGFRGASGQIFNNQGQIVNFTDSSGGFSIDGNGKIVSKTASAEPSIDRGAAIIDLAKEILTGINSNNSQNAVDPNALLAQQQQIDSLTKSSAQLQNMIANQSQTILANATARQTAAQPSFFEKNKTVIIASGVGVGVLGLFLLLRK